MTAERAGELCKSKSSVGNLYTRKIAAECPVFLRDHRRSSALRGLFDVNRSVDVFAG